MTALTTATRRVIVELIIRLTQLHGPSREVDALIHRAVTPDLHDTLTETESGFKYNNGWLLGGDHLNPTQAPNYTISLDDALGLLPPGHDWGVKCQGSGFFAWCTADLAPTGDVAVVTAATPAAALVLSALRIREKKP